jgi:hypothetical protein
VRSTADLRALQRMMTHALVRPLEEDGGPSAWLDGRPMAEVAAEFIKPNDRLTSLERLEIYHRVYWARLIDCAADDNPGLVSLLGEKRFNRLICAYLVRYPSRSFTLRDLCSGLPRFIREEPRWTAPRTALAAEVAAFEWAQTEAFDGAARPLPTPDEVAGTPPSRLRLALQPHVSLLALRYPVDAFVSAVKRRNFLRGDASNASSGVAGNTRDPSAVRARAPRRVAPPRPGRVHVAVFRVGGRLRSERLTRQGFLILEAIRAGRPLSRALGAGGRVAPARAGAWFATWMKLGWFCLPRHNKDNP